MTFSQKLKYILSEQNISQAELSRLTGINKSSICQYLSGKNIPSNKRQGVIATAIGMPEDYFGNENFKEPSIPYPKIPRLTLTETAGIMGVSQRALALAIQQGMYSWAQALPGRNKKRPIYFINAITFAKAQGIDLEEYKITQLNCNTKPEKWKEKIMNEEEKTLNLDDVKFLLEKIHAAQQAGNHVIFRHSNYSTEVIAMEGEISEEKEWDKQFYMHNNAPEEQKATYNECILYLEKLAGEKHDN